MQRKSKNNSPNNRKKEITLADYIKLQEERSILLKQLLDLKSLLKKREEDIYWLNKTVTTLEETNESHARTIKSLQETFKTLQDSKEQRQALTPAAQSLKNTLDAIAKMRKAKSGSGDNQMPKFKRKKTIKLFCVKPGLIEIKCHSGDFVERDEEDLLLHETYTSPGKYIGQEGFECYWINELRCGKFVQRFIVYK